jgi:hypothetical protein
MPKFRKDKPITNSGIYITAGDIQRSDFDDRSWQEQQETYMRMRNGEPIISRCSNLLVMPVLQTEYRIEHTPENQEAADYLDYVWSNLDFQSVKYHLLQAVFNGLSMGELLWTKGDKWNRKIVNRLFKINFFQNETIQKFYYNEYGDFIGIQHENRIPEGASSLVEIKEGDTVSDITQVLHWLTYNMEYNDVRGKSILRPLTMAYDAKEKCLLAIVRACQRGAGIPIIETIGTPSSSDQSGIETIGQTITAMQNGYISYNKDMMNVRLEELKGQKDNMPLLEFFNRELFFGMMLEFSTSGIGQNGSRAATEAHQAPYELQANYILRVLEDNIAQLNDVILSNTPWANLTENPVLKFNSITQIDTFKLSQTMRNMYDSMIFQKNPEDEKYFREIFGMPIVDVDTSVIQGTKKAEKKSREATKFELEVFSMESATEGYIEAQEESQKILQDIYVRALSQVAGYLQESGKTNFQIKQEYKTEMVTKLTSLYAKLWQRGYSDVNSELAKLKKDFKLADTPKIAPINKSIKRMTDKFFFNIQSIIEDKLEKTNLEKKSVNEIVMGFEDSFKGDKRNLFQAVEDGYTEGRGEALKASEEVIEEYICTAILDKSLCDECAPYDNLTFTKKELDSEGLNIGRGRVNPACLGSDNCRCQIAPYKLY